MPDAYTD